VSERAVFPTTLMQDHDPYPFLNDLRERAPVVPVRWRGIDTWLVTRYADCRSGLADPRLSHDASYAHELLSRHLGDEFILLMGMEGSDPPRHTRLRRAVSTEFTAHRIRRLEPLIRDVTNDMLETVADKDQVDLAKLFEPLPVTIMSELLGVPLQVRGELLRLARDFFQPVDNPSTAGVATGAIKSLSEYFLGVVQRHRAGLARGGLIEVMISDRGGEPELTDDEIADVSVELVAAGGHTTGSLLGNGFLSLIQHPDQMALLRHRTELIPYAIEEILRFDGSLLEKHVFSREALSIAGTRIPAGHVLLLCLGSANRDPRRYRNPDQFDVQRRSNSHLGFGHGIHFCLGAPLARLIAKTVFESVLRRYSGIEVTSPAETIRRSPSALRRLDELPVRLTPS
jgi:cytochrome P450